VKAPRLSPTPFLQVRADQPASDRRWSTTHEFRSDAADAVARPSGIGFVLFMYGRKQQRWPQLVAGILLMIYPYFVETVLAMIGVGIAIGAGMYALIANDW
jgi:hypothetical protein